MCTLCGEWDVELAMLKESWRPEKRKGYIRNARTWGPTEAEDGEERGRGRKRGSDAA